jgi:glucose/arabinose dehydrogenase
MPFHRFRLPQRAPARTGGPGTFSLRSAAAITAVAAVGLLSVSTLVRVSPALAQRVAPTGRDGKLPVSGTTIPASTAKIRLVEFAKIEQPVAVVMRNDDDAMYVVGKNGKITAWVDDKFRSTPVLDISARIDSTNERGLLGLAFSESRPDLMYIDYTDRKGVVHISEIPFDGTTANLAKERVLLRIPKPFNEHNAGTIVFDNDDQLLIAIGDGGGSNDKFNNGQRTDTLLGKVLRINPTPNGQLQYSIPIDNPFASESARSSKKRPEILAYGLRNPWRISVDRTTGDIWVPDVGQSTAEEINRLPKSAWGANFGWRIREGDRTLIGGTPRGYVKPVFSYPHLDGRCAVAGGELYRGDDITSLVGTYVFGDVCTGAISALRPRSGQWKPEDLGAKIPYLSAFGVTNDGELIAISLEGGLYRIEAA